jgi:Domain of Unknown Function with PDB structure (DUF3858)/Transglutaminase-like superfamily
MTKGQDKPADTFGNVSLKDFSQEVDSSQKGASAVILADIENVYYEQNAAGEYEVITKRFSRVKIINRAGLEAGKFVLHLNTFVPFHSIILNLPPPGLEDLRGVTFKLENGVIHEDKLDLSQVVTEKDANNHISKKFIMPGLTEGSIFDIEYKIRTHNLAQQLEWSFQNNYPCLWSEYDVKLPFADQYFIKYLGDSNFFVHSVDSLTQNNTNYTYNHNVTLSHFRWVKINEPAITTEPYIGSVNNYVDRVSFLRKWKLYTRNPFRDYNSDSWEGFSSIYFLINGLEKFDEEKYPWMTKEINIITAGQTSQNEAAKSIFMYIRDHFSCTNQNNYFTSQSLKETFNNKFGTVGDINLLLTAMLHQLKIDANPAVLSTVDHGYGNLSFPLPSDYNYLICVAKINGRELFLDASRPLNPYGKISFNCYNGGAATLNTVHSNLIKLPPDSLYESNRANVIITSDEKGALSGSLTINCGSQKSYSIREEVKKTSIKEFFSKSIINGQIKSFANEELENLDNPDEPLTVYCEMDFDDTLNSSHIYMKPVVYSYLKTNPFLSEKRQFKVEMPFRMDNIYLLTMDIPKGYHVEEMPASIRIQLNQTDGFFEYIIEKNSENIQLRMRMKLNKTVYGREEYSNLREFINSVLNKENEQIVLNKNN